MHAQNTAELITMAEDPQVSDQDFAEAFLHYTPGANGTYATLLKVMIAKRRQALKVLGITLHHARHTRATLIALQKRHQENFAS